MSSRNNKFNKYAAPALMCVTPGAEVIAQLGAVADERVRPGNDERVRTTSLAAAARRDDVPERTPSDVEFISIPDTCKLLGGIDERTLRRWTQAGDFPRPVHCGGRAMHVRSEVVNYMRRKMQERSK